MKLIKLLFILFLFNGMLFSQDVKKVSLQLHWKYQFQFAGFIMAKHKGFYKKNLLDVDIKEWQPNIVMTDEITSGRATYALDHQSVLVDIANGKDIVLLSAIFQSSPLCLVTTNRSGIKSIKDFKNKRMMSSGDMKIDASLVSMMFSQGVSINDIFIQEPSFNVRDLIDGNTDLMASYISNEPYQLEELGVKPIIFSPKDYGFDFYSDILITSQEHLKNNPSEVKRFVDASLKGWEYAFNHIDETVDIILKNYNSLHKSKKALIYEANKLKKLAYTNTDKIGNISKNKLNNIYTTYQLLGLANKNRIDFDKVVYKLDKNTIFTNDEKEWINKNIVKVGVSPWYPITYIDKKNNKVSGVGIDILNLVINNTGLKVEFIPKKWSILLEDFKNHKIDLLPTTYYTQNRAKFGDYTTSYMDIKEYLYVKSNSDIKSFKDLKNRSIAIVRSYGTIDKIKKKFPDINIVEVDSIEQTVKMLLNGEVDAIFNTKFSIDNFIKSHFISGLKPIYQTDFKPSTLHYFTNKNKPILNKILQKAIDNLDKKNVDKIINNWIISNNVKKEDSNFLTKDEIEYLKNNKIIKMCNNPNWTPIEFAKDGDMNKMQGIAIDTLDEIAKKLNVKFVNVPTKNWTQSQQFLKEKKCDILPCAIKTKERLKYAKFTEPYLSYKLAIITKNDKPFINSIEDIVDKSIARKEGSGLIVKLKNKYPNIKIIETKDYLESLQKVSKGEAYCTIATLPVASYYIGNFALGNLQVAGYTNMKYDLSIAVRDDKDILLSIMEKSLKQIPQSVSKDIYKKWLGNPIKKSAVDYTPFLYVLLGIIVIILLLLYKQMVLKSSIRDFNELIDATMEGILLFKNRVCVDANRSAVEIFGYDSKEEMIGKTPFDFVSNRSENVLKINMKKDEASPFEAVMVKKDGTEFYALLRGHNLKNKQLRLASIIDITNLKKQEKLIYEQSKLASMGEMIGNIAHQWRQPLSVISTASTGMKIQKEFDLLSDEQFLKTCDLINKNAQYLSKTIDDFRNFIKGNRTKTYFNIKDQLNSFINLVDGSIKSNNIKLVLDVKDDIEVNGYENELTQCVINIFNNAKDALVENVKENRLILVKAKVKDNYLIISFQDNALGIPNEILPKIFEPYFTTKHKTQGTGLGLNMTYKLIVDGMHGSIVATNKKFKYEGLEYYGAEFIIKIPLD